MKANRALDVRSRIALILGYVIMSAAIIGVVLGGLYWIAAQLSMQALRWTVVALLLVLPAAITATWIVATNVAREHLRGFDRGLDGAERTIQSVGRGLAATASMARSAKAISPQVNNEDLLPRVGQMRILAAGHNEDMVEM